MPILIHRKSGLTLILWEDGSCDVLPTPEAQALVEHMALCQCCMEARGE